MRFDSFSFGSIRIDGVTCDYDVMIDGGEIRKRKKKQSKQFRDEFGHTPHSGYGAAVETPTRLPAQLQTANAEGETWLAPAFTWALPMWRQPTDRPP
jgi:hypothetical protein